MNMKKCLRVPLLALHLCALFAAAGAQSRSLDEAWRLAVDREGKLTINDLNSVKDWREIQVPLSWNVQFPDLRDYRGVAWYRKSVDLQQIKPDQTILLKFGAADYFAEVFVNGQKAGARSAPRFGWRTLTARTNTRGACWTR
jgi:beta-galactosidase/beta-glucuronidase